MAETWREVKARIKAVDKPLVKGKVGNPGIKNPKKRGGGAFRVLGVERKGRQMGFRPVASLEQHIDEALQASGLKQSEFLELAAIAYLEKSPEEMWQELEQLLQERQFSADPTKPIPKNVRREIAGAQKESPKGAGAGLEQGQLSSDNSRTEEPAAAASDEAPTSGSNNTGGEEDQAGDTQTSRKSQRSPRAGAKTRKAATS